MLRTIFYSSGIAILAMVLIIELSTSNKSSNLPQLTLTNTDIQRAKDILDANQKTAGNLVSLELTERDLNIACTYLLNLYVTSHIQVQLVNQHIAFKLQLTLPENLFGRYLPIQFDLHLPPYSAPEVKNLHIGSITIADTFAGLVIDNIIKYTRLNQYLALIRQNIKTIELRPEYLFIQYQHPGNIKATQAEAAAALLPSSIDSQTLQLYQNKLDESLRQHDAAWLLSLSDVLQPLFKLAQQRATPTTAIEENRLAIFVANQYVNHYPDSSTKPPAQLAQPNYPVYLYKRSDMAQHFMWSATLTALGNSQLAKIIGEEKELHDAKSGSGFSFIDLAADRAGMSFGEQATATPEMALKIQQNMLGITDYRAFMPDFQDLPERLNSKTFKAQYQSVESEKYQAMLAEIDRRIAACAIYN